MSTVYRSVRRSEEAEMMQLRTSVFEVPAPFFQTLLDVQADRRLRQTRVALTDGKMVSGLDVFYRTVRQPDGSLGKMGGIGSVATYEEHRGKGHSGHLLRDVIRVMEEDGCDWSLLFTGVNPHYARYGWVTIETPYRVGELRTGPGAKDPEVVELGQSTRARMGELARIHATFNAARPITAVRTARTWRTAIYYRMGPDSGARVFVDRARGQAEAYVVVRCQGVTATVVEAGVTPGHEDRLLATAEQVRLALAATGITTIHAYLPREPLCGDLLDRMATDVKDECHHAAMVRPIRPGLTADEVASWFKLPSALHWPLDDF